MAQVVKLEPGDILIIGNCGRLHEDFADWDEHLEWLGSLKAKLQLDNIILFEGDPDLSKLPADAVAGA